MDLDSTLQEYQIQLEQVELALKSEAENEELLKLKIDLEEVIKLTEDLINETKGDGQDQQQQHDDRKRFKYDEAASASANIDKMTIPKQLRWKSGDKCQAIWRQDGKHYPCVIDQLVENESTCTVIFNGYKTSEIVQISQLMPLNKSGQTATYDPNKRPLTKRELEQKLREAKKRKREKFEEKLKNLEELSEKDKNKWKSFNSKLASKTWKGVVKKNKFELPSHHENRIGVGVNNRAASVGAADTTTVPQANTSAKAAATHIQQQQQQHSKPQARYKSESYKQTMF